MDRCRNPSATLHKRITGELIHRHDRCITKQSTELNHFANPLTNYRDQTNRRSLLVHHTNCRLIRNNTRNRRSLVSPGIAIISRPTEHTQVIASSFSRVSAPCIHRINHTLILADRNKCTTQTTNCCRSHNSTLLNLVI